MVLSLLSGALTLAAPRLLDSDYVHWPLVLVGCIGLVSVLGIFIGDPQRPLPGYVQLFVLQLKGAVVLVWGLLFFVLEMISQLGDNLQSKVSWLARLDLSGPNPLLKWLLAVGIIDLLTLLVALVGAFVMFRPHPAGEDV
jgi:hypothetical protein